MDAYPPDTDQLLFGVAIGIVTNNKDPEGLGRVKTSLPWMDGSVESDWARVVTPMAGAGRGVYFLPEVNDEVLVAFEHGNPDMPYVLGSLWNGKDKPPATNGDGKNDVRVIRSRGGSVIRLTDTDQDARIEIADSSGKNTMVIRAKDNSITITAAGTVTIEAGSGKLRLSGKSVEIAATSTVSIESGQTMDVKATGQLTVKGSVVNIN
ncbi:MAG TPA: phage baseplate assembly protein V [Streptosporangiaceae bacterium]|nr:phage baseplate assembly protein V [Streptosporangiaceae bacterium]